MSCCASAGRHSANSSEVRNPAAPSVIWVATSTEIKMTPRDYPKPPFPATSESTLRIDRCRVRTSSRLWRAVRATEGSGQAKERMEGGNHPVRTRHRPSGCDRICARRRADILIAFLNETEEANGRETSWRRTAVAKAVLAPATCRTRSTVAGESSKKASDDLGGIDIPSVNNAAHQATFKDIGDISDEVMR